ncbi:MAG: zinc ribbon domain-containing protein [Thermoplasmata archaeon]
MTAEEIKSLVLFLIIVAGVIFVIGMGIRILLKVRKGPSVKKRKETKVLEAISSTPDSDDIFNIINSTRRIATDLKRRGIDTGSAEDLISKANTYYDQGLEKKAKFTIEEAKELLLSSKKDWDKKTGFGVVSSNSDIEARSTPKEIVDLVGENQKPKEVLKFHEEIPDISNTIEKKPDNYLAAKFTISLAGTAKENAMMADSDASEAQRLLTEAKACFAKEDYDEAFKLALCSKRGAEALFGVAPGEGEEGKKIISDLATAHIEPEELKICSICGERKIAYICIEVNGGEETTCRECYEESIGRMILPKIEPPPPPEEIKGEEEEKEEEQNYCPNCGAKVKNEDVFCGKCGKPVKEELKCVGCGTKVEPGDMFCRKCGARLVT